MAFLIHVVGPRSPGSGFKCEGPGCENDRQVSPPLELSIEQAVQQVLDEEKITMDLWTTSRNGMYFKVEFSVLGEGSMERVLDRLAFFNVGKTTDSSIMVTEPTAFICKRTKERKSGYLSNNVVQQFMKSLKSRLCVAQVYHEINQRGIFDMNYLCFLVCAALIADIALVTNSAGVVFASMLLSPLMDPILCILFGLTLREGKMLKRGIRNTAISLFMCIALGFTFGFVAHTVSNFEDTKPYPTAEMKQRGQVHLFLSAMLVAGLSGISVAFATLSRRLAALIGNAISLSLLPPAVNCGQLLLLSVIAASQSESYPETRYSGEDPANLTATNTCTFTWIRNYTYVYATDTCETAKEMAMLGFFSLLLVTMNIILILVTGYTVNKLKNMAPRSFTNETIRRFYQKDLPEVIGNYDCLHKLDAGELATVAYNEYLRLNQINPESGELSELSREETRRLASNFRAVLHGIEQDQHLRTISAKTAHGDNFLQSFVQRSNALVAQASTKPHQKTSLGWHTVSGHLFCDLLELPPQRTISHSTTTEHSHRSLFMPKDDVEAVWRRGSEGSRLATDRPQWRLGFDSFDKLQIQLSSNSEPDNKENDQRKWASTTVKSHSVISEARIPRFSVLTMDGKQSRVGKFHVVPTELSLQRLGADDEPVKFMSTAGSPNRSYSASVNGGLRM